MHINSNDIYVTKTTRKYCSKLTKKIDGIDVVDFKWLTSSKKDIPLQMTCIDANKAFQKGDI